MKRQVKCHSEPFACHSERSEESRFSTLNSQLSTHLHTYIHKLTPSLLFLFASVLFPLCLINTPATAGWQTVTVDSTGNVGEYTSLAFDPTYNIPAISYRDSTNGDLKYAYYHSGQSQWIKTTVDSEGNVGWYTSLAFDPIYNIPAISYHDSTNGALKYAYYHSGQSQWIKTTVDSARRSDRGEYSSLAFDLSGKPAISYQDGYGSLRFARSNGASWDITIVDSVGYVGRWTSLAFDPILGTPAISYFDGTNGDLKYAYYISGLSLWITTTVASIGYVGEYTSLAFDPIYNINLPAISYYDSTNGALKYAYYRRLHSDQFQWIITTVDSGKVGAYTSLAFDPIYDFPAISYYDWYNDDLKYARFNGDSWDITTVDSTGDVGWYTSLAFDLSGNPAISYYKKTNGNLKFARFVPEEICNNGIDDDGDGLVDCDDAADCGVSFTQCVDYDMDGYGNPYDCIQSCIYVQGYAPNNQDCDDMDDRVYPGAPEICNGVDDNCNGQIDEGCPVVCQCPEDNVPPTGCISGRVMDFAGNPLANKTIKLKRVKTLVGTTITSGNGCYQFTNLTDGTYKVILKCCKTCTALRQTRTITGGGKVNNVNFECQ